MQEYWRKKKQESRERLKEESERQPVKVHLYDHAYKKSAIRVAAHRARKMLPRSPRKFAATIKHILKNISPRKRNLLEQSAKTADTKQVVVSETFSEIRKNLKSLSEKRDYYLKRKVARSLINRSVSLRENSRRLVLRWSYLQSVANKAESGGRKRCDRISGNDKQYVVDFFRHADIAVTIPDARQVTKQGVRRILNTSLKEAYKQYENEAKQDKKRIVGKTTFWKYKPKNIKYRDTTKLVSCLCECCANMDQMIKVIVNCTKRFPRCETCEKLRKNVGDCLSLAKMTLCSGSYNNGFPEKSCLDRECRQCGVTKLCVNIMHLNKHNITSVTWYRWENVTTEEKVKKALISISGSLQHFMAVLEEDIDKFPKHLYTAIWQSKQFKNLKSVLPVGTILMVMDFGQNYLCLHQDEPQEIHWGGHNQITIHPVVCYYKHKCVDHQKEILARHEIVMISDDLRHDTYAVREFEKKALQVLKQDGVIVRAVIEFTDGSASQYKSRKTFEDISKSSIDLDVSVKRAFFGSRHGKGPSDAVTAVVKSAARRAVCSRKEMIQKAEDLIKFCENNLTRGPNINGKCNISRCSFILVKTSDIERTRTYSSRTIPGTRQLHYVEPVNPGKVLVRELACFCFSCLTNSGKCENNIVTARYL